MLIRDRQHILVIDISRRLCIPIIKSLLTVEVSGNQFLEVYADDENGERYLEVHTLEKDPADQKTILKKFKFKQALIDNLFSL